MNKKTLKKQLKRQNGITLIALVITIVILIILATISINFVFNGGLIDRAEQAREYYQNDEAYTDESVSNLTGYIDGLINGIEGGSGGSGTGEKPTTIDEAKGKGVLGEETVLADNAGNKVTVPGEFGVSADSGSNVKDGVVIEDGEGNQYVWVPVTKDENGENTAPYSETGTLTDGTEIKLSRYTFDEEGVATDRGNSSFFEFPGNYTPCWFVSENVNYLEEFKLSVAENGGYYIARYEASYGADGKANSKVSELISNDTDELQEGTLWNYITQTDAISASQNLYMETNSELINSYAWDTALLYIQKCSENNQYSKATAPSDTLANTGSRNDEICKINDLSGNLGEWTTESAQWLVATVGATTNGVVCRGGRYNKPSYYTAFRGENVTSFKVLPTDTGPDMGFRVILYI